MEPTHRLKIKIGSAEFEAEGAPEMVKAQYESFLAALTLAAKTPPTPAPALAAAAFAPASPNDDGRSETPTPPGGAALDRALLERVFSAGDPLSLAALPRSDNANADALLVLIYGYNKLRGEQSVTGTMLMKSAKKSGVPVERVDRSMGSNTAFILTAGAKKGRRYSLNNRGVVEAEGMIRKMVE